MAKTGSNSGSDEIDWAALAVDSASSSASDDEELALRIALHRSRTDQGGSSSSTLSPVARQLQLGAGPRLHNVVRAFLGHAVGRLVAAGTTSNCSSQAALGAPTHMEVGVRGTPPPSPRTTATPNTQGEAAGEEVVNSSWLSLFHYF